MPSVVVRAALDQVRGDRQDRRSALQRLNLGLLVAAQHHRALRRVQVDADDVDDLGLQLGVDGEPERPGPPALDPMGAPRLGDRGVPTFNQARQTASWSFHVQDPVTSTRISSPARSSSVSLVLRCRGVTTGPRRTRSRR
jgi:hypothetical protein